MDQIDRYDRIFGLVIGVSDYSRHDTFDSLDGVKPTVDKVQSWMLNDLGIARDDVKRRSNQTGDQIEQLIKDLGQTIDEVALDGQTVGAIVYLAGHGTKSKLHRELSSFHAKSGEIKFSRFKNEYRYYFANAHHVLFILDCCHSGEAIQAASELSSESDPITNAYFQASIENPCIQVMTSSSPDQKSWFDQKKGSLFFDALRTRLAKHAVIPVTALTTELRIRTKYEDQIADCRRLDGDGDFILGLKPGEPWKSEEAEEMTEPSNNDADESPETVKETPAWRKPIPCAVIGLLLGLLLGIFFTSSRKGELTISPVIGELSDDITAEKKIADALRAVDTDFIRKNMRWLLKFHSVENNEASVTLHWEYDVKNVTGSDKNYNLGFSFESSPSFYEEQIGKPDDEQSLEGEFVLIDSRPIANPISYFPRKDQAWPCEFVPKNTKGVLNPIVLRANQEITVKWSVVTPYRVSLPYFENWYTSRPTYKSKMEVEMAKGVELHAVASRFRMNTDEEEVEDWNHQTISPYRFEDDHVFLPHHGISLKVLPRVAEPNP